MTVLVATSGTPARPGAVTSADAPAPGTVAVRVGAPIVPAPARDAPVDGAPVDDAPIDGAPIDGAPARPAPAGAGTASGTVGSGRHGVGADVVPGVYDSAGPGVPEGVCSWSRRGVAPGGDVVLAAGTSREPLTVTVRPGDAVFTTAGCAPWRRR